MKTDSLSVVTGVISPLLSLTHPYSSLSGAQLSGARNPLALDDDADGRGIEIGIGGNGGAAAGAPPRRKGRRPRPGNTTAGGTVSGAEGKAGATSTSSPSSPASSPASSPSSDAWLVDRDFRILQPLPSMLSDRYQQSLWHQHGDDRGAEGGGNHLEFMIQRGCRLMSLRCIIIPDPDRGAPGVAPPEESASEGYRQMLASPRLSHPNLLRVYHHWLDTSGMAWHRLQRQLGHRRADAGQDSPGAPTFADGPAFCVVSEPHIMTLEQWVTVSDTEFLLWRGKQMGGGGAWGPDGAVFASILLQVMLSVDHLGSLGLSHRGIVPQSVFLVDRGSVGSEGDQGGGGAGCSSTDDPYLTLTSETGSSSAPSVFPCVLGGFGASTRFVRSDGEDIVYSNRSQLLNRVSSPEAGTCGGLHGGFWRLLRRMTFVMVDVGFCCRSRLVIVISSCP
jgi:hypothetical protein